MTEPGAVKGPLVLYVDDERGNRVVFETSMKAEFNLKVAADPLAALEILEGNDVAVIVTDMRMPTMSGEELLRIAKEKWPQTIRMVVTAYSDIDPILRAINEGLVARYIIKPWVRTELMQVLRWATEAWVLGRDSAAVHRRLMETERLATLGSISGMLVHDLKQPLMSLAVNAELLRELAEYAPVLRQALEHVALPEKSHLVEMIDELGQVTDDIKTSIEHLNDLITSLRGFSAQRRADPSVPVATDPLPILRHAMSVCQELAVKVRAQIGYEGPRELPRVRIPPTELTQVLINLVANGAQAVAARGAPNGKVSIMAREADGMLTIEVKDDGVGMTNDVLKRVGTPFFTTRAQGTGLGLAQCQRLIGTAGGRLRIESEPGKGTTVTISLPIAA
jgi:signal transduction histidine kinase